MSPVAERLAGCGFAATEKLGTAFFRFIHQGGEFGALMTTVTKGLTFRAATSAPEVFLTFFHIDFDRGLLGDNGFGWIV